MYRDDEEDRVNALKKCVNPVVQDGIAVVCLKVKKNEDEMTHTINLCLTKSWNSFRGPKIISLCEIRLG